MILSPRLLITTKELVDPKMRGDLINALCKMSSVKFGAGVTIAIWFDGQPDRSGFFWLGVEPLGEPRAEDSTFWPPVYDPSRDASVVAHRTTKEQSK